MCSSNIIRKGGELQKSFILEPLGSEPPKTEPHAFRAIHLGQEGLDAAEPETEEAWEPPPSIPEEEALRRIQQAHADGVKEGRKVAEAALTKVGEALAQALLATGSLRARVMQESEEDLLKLSALIARKIMLREVSWDPGILVGMVQGALELASDGGEVVVRLNPDDYEAVANRPEFVGLATDKGRITVKGDPTVPSAGCLVETHRGNIDAGLDGQLDQIYRRLAEERSARRGNYGED